MKNNRESKSLQEVWDWKDECYREVAHLPFKEAVRKRFEDSQRRARELGFVAGARPHQRRLAVAEGKEEYGTE